jgi:DNA-binding IscR family transcriptional regulator
MSSNSKFAMAAHVMVAIAHMSKHKGVVTKNGFVPCEAIAKSINTHTVVVRRIVGELSKAKLVIAHKGKHGGVELVKTPNRISLLDILDAIGGVDIFSFNPNKSNRRCAVSRKMPHILEPIFFGLDNKVRQSLKAKRRRFSR